MSNQTLKGKRIAILATDGFEQSELIDPKKLLEAAGAQVDVVSPAAGKIRGWKSKDWGDEVAVDRTLDQARADDYDGLVLPGGQINPDKLRIEPRAVSLIQAFARSGKTIGAICHGPWLLVEAGLVRDKRVTSWPSVRTDLQNAGAKWEDHEVVVDGGLITSRNPQDIPAFAGKLIEAFAASGERRRAA